MRDKRHRASTWFGLRRQSFTHVTMRRAHLKTCVRGVTFAMRSRNSGLQAGCGQIRALLRHARQDDNKAVSRQLTISGSQTNSVPAQSGPLAEDIISSTSAMMRSMRSAMGMKCSTLGGYLPSSVPRKDTGVLKIGSERYSKLPVSVQVHCTPRPPISPFAPFSGWLAQTHILSCPLYRFTARQVGCPSCRWRYTNISSPSESSLALICAGSVWGV